MKKLFVFITIAILIVCAAQAQERQEDSIQEKGFDKGQRKEVSTSNGTRRCY